MNYKQKLAKTNYIALKYFCTCLSKSKKAKKYLLNRVSKRIIQNYYLGFAPKQGLIEYLNKYNVSGEVAQELGLIDFNDDDTAYEIFSERIVFPVIYNKMVVGFAGRTIKDHPVKYLNSKTTPLYMKKSMLYGVDAARKSIYKKGWCILVEGYFDVLALVDHGILNVVASCGTAFSEDQGRILRRWTGSVYTCYDSDTAGKKAAKKAAKILKKHGIYGGAFKMPKGSDPDECIHKFGKKHFLSLKKN